LGEGYLVYSSLTAVFLGCLTLGLSILFRLKSRGLINLSEDPFATVFDHTFNIFDPYPLQKKLIHRFLSVLPLVVVGISFGLLFFLITVVASGLILSVLILIVGLNLVVIEEAPEVYENCKTFSKALQSGTGFGNGDLKVFRLIKNLAPKLSKYYICLSILFFGFAATLPALATSVPWLFSRLVDSIMQLSGVNGNLVIEAVGLLLALSLGFIQILAFRIKGKMFKHEV
jgi:hypothetical protein